MAVTTESRKINGIDVYRLKETINSVRKNSSLANTRFHIKNQWLAGDRNRSEIEGFCVADKEISHPKKFKLDSDEPKMLLGDDKNPNPVEYVLHALAGCVTTSLINHAAANGIEIESVETEVQGDIDLQGFLGVSKSVPKGFKNIRVTMHVKSDASAEKLEQLARYSPVYDTLTRPVPVELNVEKK